MEQEILHGRRRWHRCGRRVEDSDAKFSKQLRWVVAVYAIDGHLKTFRGSLNFPDGLFKSSPI